MLGISAQVSEGCAEQWPMPTGFYSARRPIPAPVRTGVQPMITAQGVGPPSNVQSREVAQDKTSSVRAAACRAAARSARIAPER